MARLTDIVAFTNDFLEIDKFEDYSPNGLQVEGNKEVKRIVSGVTASQALIDGAIELGADMILVHHGFFWRGESNEIVGLKYQKIKSLIESKISLVAYHLPLDAHPLCGNNAQLAKRLGVSLSSTFGPGKIPLGVVGELGETLTADIFVDHIQGVLKRKPLHIGANLTKRVKKIALCTGGAQSYFSSAIEQGVDIFVTGEVSEQNYHMALESGVNFVAAGHHATERYGVQALADLLREKFSVEVNYVELANPV
ncbi:MAG TPA: Nif3-like dinuclear metal center hexameric protein [Gammaproteobacteria bacterium]|nr:Nif3-like dinuclear metal center hexameric protein [Gammaproteobacteria bacterium]